MIGHKVWTVVKLRYEKKAIVRVTHDLIPLINMPRTIKSWSVS